MTRIFRLAAVLTAAALANVAQAQVNYAGVSAGAWLTDTNWSTSTVPTSLETATFQAAATSVGIDLSGATNNGTNNQIVGSLSMTAAQTAAFAIGNSSTTAGGTLTLAGVGGVFISNASSFTLTIQDTAAGGTQTMALALNGSGSIGGTGAITISSAVINGSSDASINKIGTGILTLSGTNTYTGTTTVTAGRLQFTNRVSLYNATTANWTDANITVLSGATLGFNVGGAGQFTAADLDAILPLGTSTTGFHSGSGVALETTGANFTYASNITNTNGGANTRSLTKLGSNVLTLTGTNTYTGGTTISAGMLQFTNRASLYNGTTSSWTKTNINVSGVLGLNVGGANQFTTSDVTALLTNLTGTVSNNGLRSGSRIAFDTTNAVGGTFTISDNIANTTGTGGGAIGLFKVGTNVLILTGTNTYSGGTTIGPIVGTSQLSGGTLRVTTGAIGTGPIGLNNATLASASSAPVTIPGNISNTYVNGTMTFGDSVGTGVMTLTGGISLSGSGTGRNINTVADVIVTGVLSGGNSSFLTKSGAATLTLSNVAGTVTGLNNIIVTAGTLAVTRLSNSTVNSSIGRTTAAATVASITINGGALNYISGGNAASSTDRLLQIGQTTAGGTGTIRNNATNAAETVTFSNPNAILYGTIDQTRTLILGGTNIGLNKLATAINNNGTGVVTVTKQDPGTWVLSGTNGYTGVTTVSGGRLVLDYSTNDTSKLSDTVNGLTLGGATLELSGGSHTEIVTSTTLTAGTASFVTQTSGASVLQMNTITPSTGTLSFGAENIATTDNLNNASGIIGTWATVGGDWAINSGAITSVDPTVTGVGVADGFIRAYTGYVDVTRLDSGTKAIANGATTNVRIIEGTGIAGDITVTGTIEINTLNQSTSGGSSSATVALANQTLRTNGILIGTGAGSLTIGATGGSAALSGTLTNQTGAGGSLIFTNNSNSDMTINSVLAVNSTTNSFVKAGTGTLVLGGDNTFNVGFTIQEGTVKAGKNSTSAGVGPLGDTNSAVITFANNATAVLDINGFNVFAKELSGGGSFGGNVILTTGNTLTLNNPASGTPAYNGIISGGGNLSVNGSSRQTFTNSHTYTGVTTIGSGNILLRVSNLANGGVASGIGAATADASNLVFSGGGLEYNSTVIGSTDRQFTLSGNFTLTTITTGAMNFTSTGAANVTGGAKTLTLTSSSSGNGSIALSIGDGSGATSITKAGTNTWTLTNAGSTFTGTITFNTTTTSAGTLSYASAGGTNPITFNQTTSTATLAYTGPGQTMSGPIQANALSTGTITLDASGSGTVNYSNPGSLGVGGASGAKILALAGTNTGENTLAGQWADNTLGGAARITKSGAGTWVLSAANTYSGGTTINSGGGILRITNPAALGSGTIVNSHGGTTTGTVELQMTGTNTIANNWTTVSANQLSGAGVAHIRNVSGDNTLSGTITLTSTGGNGTNIESNGGLLTLSGAISSTVADSNRTISFGGTGNGLITGSGVITDTGANKLNVAKSGTGAWTFNSANTYTGNTTVSAGTLVIGLSGSLAAGSAVVVNGGTLGGTGTVNGTVSVASGATIRGDSAVGTGSLNLSNATTVNAGGILATQLTTSAGNITANSTLALTGNTLNLASGGAFTIRLLNDGGLADQQSYSIFLATNTANSYQNNGTSVTTNPYQSSDFTIVSESGSVSYTGYSLSADGSNNLVLAFTAVVVPEPGTLLGLSAAGIAIFGGLRRRRMAP